MIADRTPLAAWIEQTQAALDRGTADGRSRIPVPRPAPSVLSRPERLLAAAGAIAERLADLALGGEDQIDWLGIKMIGPEQWTIAPLNGNLYDGAGGLALFFAHYAQVAADADARFLAEAALSTVRRTLDTTIRMPGMIGLGGAIHVTSHLGLLWDDPTLLADADALCGRVAAQCDADTRLDLLGGSAGNLLAAASLAQRTGSAAARAAADAAGGHLLKTATPQAQGLAWITDLCPRPLGGFSHGAAGIAAALLEWHALTGDARARETADAALAYDRSLFDPALGNWRDLRFDAARPVAMNAWCHGAPGIAISRLRWAEQIGGPVAAEIALGVDAVLADDLGTSHTLCHGTVGNLLPAWEWARTTGYRGDEVEARIDQLLDSLEDGVACGSFPGVEVSGLFTGLAGVGLGLLRMAAPESVPCPLTLQLPAGV